MGFLILFVIFNYNSKSTDFFKSYSELFFDYYLPIEMDNEKFIGEIADSANHMNPYLRFEIMCLPYLDQWENKFKSGDYISKKKGDSSITIKDKYGTYNLKFDNKNFEGSALPCKCSKINSKYISF